MLFIATTIHLIAGTIWVGGMFFAYVILRPGSVKILEPELRLQLWNYCFSRFFNWIWVIVICTPISGYFINSHNSSFIQESDFQNLLMQAVGWIMVGIFIFVFFFPYKKFKFSVIEKNFVVASQQLNIIRKFIAINLALGISNLFIAGSLQF